MSKKVVGITAGEAHTLALTADGEVFSWGRGTFWRLGIGREEDQSSPVRVKFDGSKKLGVVPDYGGGTLRFIGVAAGAYHSLALEDDGSVWSWGYNVYGQLGYGEENFPIPCLVERFLELGPSDEMNTDQEKKPLKISYVKAGGMMSLAIDNLGGLWLWGHCPQPSSTDGEEFRLVSSPNPLPVWDFHGHTVVKVACGNEHVLALVTAGETFTGGDLICYSWGSNKYGQLGLGDNESRARPRVVATFGEDSSWAVYEVACGAHHTAVLTQSKSYDGEIGCRCWTFGLGENGQLGHGDTASRRIPQAVGDLPDDAILISLDCGLFHTCVLSSGGEVWSWGMEKGLGLCPEASLNDPGDALSPIRVQPGGTDGLRFEGHMQVACGAAHTILVAGDGHKLWAWGRGRSGVLGRGHTDDSFVPCVLPWPNLEANPSSGGARSDGYRTPGGMDQRISTTLGETQLMRSKLMVMERYASILHVSLFGKAFDESSLPMCLPDLDFFDLRKELENLLDSADDAGLDGLETFYRRMLESVKERIMKRRIREIVQECLASTTIHSRAPAP